MSAENNTDKNRGRYRIIGERLRLARNQAGLTQAELALKAGYSDRLIRKAEGGGRLNCQSLCDIVTALNECDVEITRSDLVLDPIAIASQFLNNYFSLGRSMLVHNGHFLSRDFVFECVGNPDTTRCAGVFIGVEGMQHWLELFHRTFSHRQDSAPIISYFRNENEVVARFSANLCCGETHCPEVWVNLHYVINDGLIVRLREEHDTETVVQFLRQRGKMRRSPSCSFDLFMNNATPSAGDHLW